MSSAAILTFLIGAILAWVLGSGFCFQSRSWRPSLELIVDTNFLSDGRH
jgi:hypothetical protein